MDIAFWHLTLFLTLSVTSTTKMTPFIDPEIACIWTLIGPISLTSFVPSKTFVLRSETRSSLMSNGTTGLPKYRIRFTGISCKIGIWSIETIWVSAMWNEMPRITLFMDGVWWRDNWKAFVVIEKMEEVMEMLFRKTVMTYVHTWIGLDYFFRYKPTNHL